ncbi:NGFI-A-binding protein homolog [Geodia barretti]|uniref:NGFI-A-binding protein homolog n=1 Tax=Geodia barretti TaxID=519541 RepID=A0AA35U0A8_GEOBA|nr:NGFI-A-binding protein homolog [Geodia barretti]
MAREHAHIFPHYVPSYHFSHWLCWQCLCRCCGGGTGLVPWPSRLLPKPAKQLLGSTALTDGRTDDEKMAQRPSGSGVGAAGAHLHQVLHDCNLLEYEPLLLEEGADDVSQLKELDEEEFRQLCIMVGMASKPFHVKRLQKALGRPSSQIYSSKLAGASSVTPTTTSLQLQTSHPPGNHGAMMTGIRTSALVSGGVPQSISKLPPKVQAPASTAALPSLLGGVTSSARPGDRYHQLPKQQHFEVAGANNNRMSIATHSVTPEKVHLASEVLATTSSSVTPYQTGAASFVWAQQPSSSFVETAFPSSVSPARL